MRPYAGVAWWIALLGLALAVVLTGAAHALSSRRDLGAGLLADRPGPADASTALGGVFGLAWRLQRGLVVGWLIAFVLCGALFGGTAKTVGDAKLSGSNITDVLHRLGGSGPLADAYLAAIMGILGLVAAVYAVQATLRLRDEETSGRLELVLATPAGRIRWACSHLIYGIVMPVVMLAVAGFGAGLVYGAQIHDVGGQLGRITAAAVVQAPAAWVLTGVAAALFGVAPKLSGLAWAVLVACFVVLEIGAILGLSHWVLDVSPFAHVPKLPGAAFTAVPLLWLTLITALLGAAGLAGFRRRDITG
jgi:ABC-2 type transport system permease protein